MDEEPIFSDDQQGLNPGDELSLYDDTPDPYLTLSLRQHLLAGPALGLLDPALLAQAQAPEGLSFTPVSARPGTTGGFAAADVAVTGTTDSRLDQVRGFDASAPYQVGQHGVTRVSEEEVEYEIDQITYLTQRATGVTTYRFGYLSALTTASPLVGREQISYHERHAAQDQIRPQRNNRPVMPDFFAVARATAFDQLPGVNGA